MKVEILNKAANTVTKDIITTFLIHDFPKCLLAEFNTHRALSRNWESSRARPVGAVIEQVMSDPYIPQFTGRAKGMQGAVVSAEVGDRARYRWLNARDNAVSGAQELIAIGIHKQDANRLLEPWMKVSGIVTATEWDNFYKLRNHQDAQPAFREFTAVMQELSDTTEANSLELGEWFLPWPDLTLATNVSKCASVSYANHAKERTELEHRQLHERLIQADPFHASPFEHCAIAVTTDYLDRLFPDCNTANFRGFLQYRKILEATKK